MQFVSADVHTVSAPAHLPFCLLDDTCDAILCACESTGKPTNDFEANVRELRGVRLKLKVKVGRSVWPIMISIHNENPNPSNESF